MLREVRPNVPLTVQERRLIIQVLVISSPAPTHLVPIVAISPEGGNGRLIRGLISF